MASKPETKPANVRLEAEELSILCEQIALILRSGLPLHDGIEALSENYGQTRLAGKMEALHRSVLDTGSLYQGIVEAGIFPQYMSEMTLIGERTGELDRVMEGLSLYYHREAKISRAIVSAVAYPLILVAIMATLIVVLIARVLPIFSDVFRSMGIDAASNPWMSAGVSVGRVVLIVAGALIAVTLLSLLAMRLDRSGRFRALVFRWIAPLRRTEEKISASRFSSVMAMMMHSGFPLVESLKLIGGVVTGKALTRKVEECRRAIEAGKSFPDAIEKLGLFEPLHMRMIRVGFQAGQTDVVMIRLAEIYEDEVDDAITHAVSIIEPTLVALMSVIIGAILLAIMLPLLSLMGGMA
jgi:type IV pilus assembly protein PilC